MESQLNSSGAPPRLPPDLGETRTILAADRTLMAWIRTALSMISFGFTIYKVLREFEQAGKVARDDASQSVGLLLVGMGILSMLLGTWQYWLTLREMNQQARFRIGRPVLFMAFIMSSLGVLMFATIAFRLF
jgi:putative membrane protein